MNLRKLLGRGIYDAEHIEALIEDYRITTQDYFDPSSPQEIVEYTDMEKILKGEIINPHKIQDINTQRDSPSFFVVCPNPDENISGKKLRDIVGNPLKNTYDQFMWVGHFNRDLNEVLIPQGNQYKSIEFGTLRESQNISFEDSVSTFFRDGARFQYDKFANRPFFVTSVETSELLTLIDRIYSPLNKI